MGQLVALAKADVEGGSNDDITCSICPVGSRLRLSINSILIAEQPHSRIHFQALLFCVGSEPGLRTQHSNIIGISFICWFSINKPNCITNFQTFLSSSDTYFELYWCVHLN